MTYNTEVRQLVPLIEIYQFRLLELEAKGRSAPRCAIDLQESPHLPAGIMIYNPTKYYVKEGANLYFSMTKDGNPIDPMIYIETVTE